MAIDGVFVHFLTNELNDNFKQHRLEKVTSYAHFFILQFYHNKVRKYLKIDLSARFCSAYETSDGTLPNQTNSQFVLALKKHLEGGILQDIKQYRTDRVMVFDFTTYDFIEGPKTKSLIFEAMGKHANLYLIVDDILVDCYKKSFVADGRHLIPGAQFEHFKSDKKDATDYEFNALLSPKEITDTYLGISLRLASLLAKSPIHPYDLVFKPTLSPKENRVYFSPIFEDSDAMYFETLSAALSSRKFEETRVNAVYERWLAAQIKKHQTRHTTLLKQYEDAQDGSRYLDLGNQIYSSGLDLKQKITHLDNILLDPLKTLNDNAQSYFKKYQKSKRALIHLDEQLAKQQDMIDALIDLNEDLKLCEAKDLHEFEKNLIPFGYKSKQTQHKKKNQKPTILSFKEDGVIYYMGKHALQNEYLVHTLSQKHFYWFHVKNASGAHVVVDTNELTETIIRKAAMLAAYHSSQKHSSSIPVDYTQIRYVAKISGKPGYYVRYKNEKTIYIDIDQTIVKSMFS